MDNQFRVGKTSVQIGEFEIGTIHGQSSPYMGDMDQYVVVCSNSVPKIFPDDWNRVMNYFLERVPAECRSCVQFVRGE